MKGHTGEMHLYEGYGTPLRRGACSTWTGAYENMLYQFCKRLFSEEQDWVVVIGEITKDEVYHAEDYISDSDFCYNFPGSFEIVIACWQEYLRAQGYGLYNRSCFSSRFL